MNLRKGAVPRQTGVLGPLPILDTSIQAWRGAGDPTDHPHSRCHCHPSLLLPTPPAASVPPPPPPPLQIKSPAWTSAPTPLLLLHSSTAQCGTLAVATLALILLLLSPALAWYKPAAGPHHYSVGRASGLLSTFHRFPSTRRSESPALPAGTGTGPLRLEMRSSLRSLALCVKDVTPNLQSCQPQFNSPGTFQCQADVSLSLREEAECQRPEP